MENEPYDDKENRGFLTIEEDPGSELNAVLVPMTGEDLDFYETAEMGYHLEEIDSSSLDEEVGLPVHAAVSHSTGDPEPNKDYLRECRDSWKQWSRTTEEDHFQRFLETTYVGGETLHDWASRNQII